MLEALSVPSKMIDALQYYESHPAAFIEEVIGAQLDQWQKEAAENLQKYHYLAIRSGSGIGKTCFLSLITLWFLATKPFCKIPTTAPTQHQLHDLLWSEHHKWLSRSKFLQDLLVWTQTRIGVRGHEPGWYAVARTAQTSPSGEICEGLQGFHSEDNLLFIVDEASGAPDAMFPAMEGSLTGSNAYCILAGNPTRVDGYFADIFNKPQLGKLYKKMHVSCYDSPRVEDRYITMMKERYGEEHPVFLIKVLGEFASGSINTLIPVSYIEAMQMNTKEKVMSTSVPARIGLDVGRSNASSILTVRQGFNVLEMVERHKAGRITDTHEICQWTIEYINAYNPEYVMIDAIGIGAGVYDGLKIIYGDMIIPVIGGQKSSRPERFLNLRAEGYWDLRELVPKLWCKEWPQRLITEMGDLRLKTTVQRDVVQIESKKDMIARSLRSPDHLDSLMYAYLSPEACLSERLMSPFAFNADFAAANNDLTKEDGGSAWMLFSKNNPVDRWRGLNA